MTGDYFGQDPWFLFLSRFVRAGSPNGAAVRPAQGNALGTVNHTRRFSTAQRANSSRGEPLARWADKREIVLHATQGVALGWANCRAFGPKVRAQRPRTKRPRRDRGTAYGALAMLRGAGRLGTIVGRRVSPSRRDD